MKFKPAVPPSNSSIEDQYQIYKKMFESNKIRFEFFKWEFEYYLSATKVLSEEFIDKYIDELDFDHIQSGQKISVDCLKKNLYKCKPNLLKQNKNISKEDYDHIIDCIEQFKDLM